MRLGSPVYIPSHFLYVPPDQRVIVDISQFIGLFFSDIGTTAFVLDFVVNLAPVLGAMLFVAIFAVGASHVARGIGDLATAGVAAMVGFSIIHLLNAWKNYLALGSFGDAQARYYVALWPFFVMAFAIGADRLLGALARAHSRFVRKDAAVQD